MNAKTLLDLCRECAHGVYGDRPPTPRYGEAVAMLLAGTAATESHLVYRRQRGFSMDSLGGAWGLWQTEAAPVGDNIKFLRARPAVLKSASAFLFLGQGELDAILGMGNHGLMRLIHDDDRFAVLMARLHYFRFAQPVPLDTRGQAEYWKTYYNTRLGKGTPDKYLADWRRLVEPAL
jgi:hypothetical protein